MKKEGKNKMSFEKDFKKLLKKHKKEFLTKEKRLNFYQLIISKFLVMKEQAEFTRKFNINYQERATELGLESVGFLYDKKTDTYYMQSKDKWKKTLENLKKENHHSLLADQDQLEQWTNEGKIKFSPDGASAVLEKEPTQEQFDKFKEIFNNEINKN